MILKVQGIQISSGLSTSLPTSIATLIAYLKTTDISNNIDYQGSVFLNEKNKSILENLKYIDNPDVVLCSMYLWNENRTHKLVKAIKEKYPTCIVIVGGPQVPEDHNELQQWATKHSYYDYFVNREGENALENIFRKLLNKDYDSNGFSFYENGKLVLQNKFGSIRNNKNIIPVPGPGSSGLLDKEIELCNRLNIDKLHFVLETNRGCPYSCTFCISGLADKLRQFDIDRVNQEIEWAKNHITYLRFADENFGILPRDIDMARKCTDIIKQGHNDSSIKMKNVDLAYAKNNKENILEIAKIMDNHDIDRAGAGFSLQTLDDNTLNIVKRDNIKTSQRLDWVNQEFVKKGLQIYTEIIIGLPGETKESFLQGLQKVMLMDPSVIRMYKLIRLRNNEMTLTDQEQSNDMKWVDFNFVPSKYDEETETQQLISSTKTMSREDMKYIRVVADMMQVFWIGKIFRYTMQYLHWRLGISYLEVLETLVHILKTYDNDICNNFRNVYEGYRVHGSAGYDDTKIFGSHLKNVGSKYSRLWAMQRENVDFWYDTLFAELKIKHKEKLTKYKDEIDDVIIFNKNMLIDKDVTPQHYFETKYDWVEFGKTQKLVKKDTSWNVKIKYLGTFKHSVKDKDARFYSAGGHEYNYSSQNSFVYAKGTYNNKTFYTRNGVLLNEDDIYVIPEYLQED